jgi:predicted membrane-bound spermidine synthase
MLLQAFYGIAVFISSACGLIIEIVAGRLLAPYVGMSLYTWTAIIAIVLLGLSIGHWIGGRLATPRINYHQGGQRVAVALALAAVTTLASLMLLRSIAGMLGEQTLSPITIILILSAAVFLLPSLFVGIVSPMLTKLAIDANPDDHGKIIGRMYALGTLGSIAGTLAAGYFFISWLGSTWTVIIVAATYAILAIIFAMNTVFRIIVIAGLILTGAILGAWGKKVNALTSPCHIESDYFCIRVEDYGSQSGRPSKLMVLDHLVHSINDRDNPKLLYSPYVQFVDEVVRARLGKQGVQQAFFIGGGGFTLPRAWATNKIPPTSIVAELDPKVTAAARELMWLPQSVPGLSIRHQDARVALQSLPRTKTFDVIFGDAFHDISVPTHLVTHEFHEEITARLRMNGVYIVNVVDNGQQPQFLLSLVKTLNKSFPVVEVWVEHEEIGNPGRVTFSVVAAQTPTKPTLIFAREGFGRSWVRQPSSKITAQINRLKLPVLTDDYAPVDRLMMRVLLAPERSGS